MRVVKGRREMLYRSTTGTLWAISEPWDPMRNILARSSNLERDECASKVPSVIYRPGSFATSPLFQKARVVFEWRNINTQGGRLRGRVAMLALGNVQRH